MVIMPRNASRSRIAILYAVFALPLAAIGVYSTNIMSANPMPMGNVAVGVSKQSYKVGEVVEFTVTNNDDAQTISVENQCPGEPLDVYRLDGTAWVQIHAQADAKKCVSEARSYAIPPHSYIPSDFRSWPNLFAQPGRYKIVAEISGAQARPSVEFDVVQ